MSPSNVEPTFQEEIRKPFVIDVPSCRSDGERHGAERLQNVRRQTIKVQANDLKILDLPCHFTTWRAHVWIFFHQWKKTDVEHPWARRYEIFSAALLVFTVFVDVLDSVNSFHISHTKNKWLFAAFEKFVVFVFTLEYVLRLWSCVEDDRYRPRGCLKGRICFSFEILPALDLLVLVVFYIDMCVSHDVRGLTTFRLIRVLRVLAVLKMERQIQSFGMIHKVLKMKKAELCATLFLAAVLLLMASCAMYYIENPSQPASFSSIPATMWWTVTALTTVGYGDIYPRTACGKILGSCVAFFGIGLFALPAGIISSGFVEVIEEKHQAECDELADMIGEDGTYLQELRDEVSTLNCTIHQMQRELREERVLNQATREDIKEILHLLKEIHREREPS